MQILMVAAENGALPGGKVGGIGDVLRDVPRALAALGHSVSVVTPAYGALHLVDGARQEQLIRARYRGELETLTLYSLPRPKKKKTPRSYVIDHPEFATCGSGEIYCNDLPNEPFARDGSKFALFCAAVAQAIQDGSFGEVEVLHLHDWHASTLAVLLRGDERFAACTDLRIVLTIHNLALQGIRPLSGHSSSLAAWFPDLPVTSDLIDPRYRECYNPLRAALLLSDRVHTVSPTYAAEICDPATGIGEGLEGDLLKLQSRGVLYGILNGCDYDVPTEKPLPPDDFLGLARSSILRWVGGSPSVRSAHLLALEKIRDRLESGSWHPARTITMISRLTDQKAGLLAVPMADGRTALDHLLDALGEDEDMVVLGSGQEAFEGLFNAAQAGDSRLLFLNGYSEALSAQLYALGSLFLMPSSFEPCGISQMLAMRAGQPCLVNRTGGLVDTVEDETTGFVFQGEGPTATAEAMIVRFREALLRLRRHKRKHETMRQAAMNVRFSWQDVAAAYERDLYR